MTKEDLLNHLKQYVMIAIGVLLMDIGYYFFFSPANLVSGGVTGISIIIKPFLDSIHMSQSIFLYIIEGVCLLLGLILLGKDFFIKTILAAILSPTYVFIFEHICSQDIFMQHIENKLLITTIVASGLSGLGIGICLNNNGSTGGMDIVQKCLSKYLHVPYSITMYLTDWVIILIGGMSFANGFSYNIENVVFGLVSVYLIAYIIDTITLNARTRRTAYIITTKPEEIKELIYIEIGRGVTEANVRGGYTKEDKTMLICVLDKTESYKLGEKIKHVDKEAFTFFTKTKEVVGEYDRKPEVQDK